VRTGDLRSCDRGFSCHRARRRVAWDDVVPRRSFLERFWTCSRLDGRSRTSRQTCRSVTSRSARAHDGRRQHRIDRGLVPGLTSLEKAELIAARKPIVVLQVELKTTRRAMELVRERRPQEAVRGHRGDGLRRAACLGGLQGVEGVRVALRRVASPAPSEREVRHATVTAAHARIRQIHVTSRGIYGSRRVHADSLWVIRFRPVTARSTCPMRRAGIVGIGGRRRWKYTRRTPSAPIWSSASRPAGPEPAVGHRHHRTPHREGKVYRAAVLGHVPAPGHGLVERLFALGGRW
jgi:putative transposase